MNMPPSTVMSALGGAVTIIATWLLKQFKGIDLPVDVGQAFTLIVTVLLGHFIIDPPKDAGQ